MGNGAVIQERQIEDALIQIKYPELIIRKGNELFYYVCNTAKYNWFLNRYYPNAELIMITETLN